MTSTPWGDSGSLRDRQLQPIRGASAEVVAKSQRERLYAATVALVAEKGYARTTLGELVDLSGVSSRSFYRLFPDKAACLRATVEAIVAVAEGKLEPAASPGDFEAELRSLYHLLAQAAIEQPAATKVCLIECLAAGEEAYGPVRQALARIESRLRLADKERPQAMQSSKEMLAARVGGVLEIVRTRLRHQRESELPDLTEDVIALLLSDRRPPERLRAVSRAPKPQPESLAAADHAERAIRAFAILVAEKGYEEVKAEEVIKKAGMSSTTFYARFSGKEDLMAAAIDSASAQAAAAVMPAISRQAAWPDAVRAGFDALLSFLASRPALAHLVTVDVYAAGDVALKRQIEGVERFGTLFENNTTEWPAMPPVVFEALGGSIRSLLFDTVSVRGAPALPALAALFTYMTLLPFLGPEGSCQVANGGGTPPRLDSDPFAVRRAAGSRAVTSTAALQGSFTLAVHLLLLGRAATAEEVAAQAGKEVEAVRSQLEEAAEAGALERQAEADGPVRFRHPATFPDPRTDKLHLLTAQQVSKMPAPANRELLLNALKLVSSEWERAIECGNFDGRVDQWFVRTPLLLDEEGWRELGRLHDRFLKELLDVQVRSGNRLAETDEQPIPAVNVQLMFEVAPEDAEGEPT